MRGRLAEGGGAASTFTGRGICSLDAWLVAAFQTLVSVQRLQGRERQLFASKTSASNSSR